MKSKDQLLLEKAYHTVLFKENKEENKEVESSSLDQWNDEKIKKEKTFSNEAELKRQYIDAFKKRESDEINSQQFGDICCLILGQLWNNEISLSNQDNFTTGEDFELENRRAQMEQH